MASTKGQPGMRLSQGRGWCTTHAPSTILQPTMSAICSRPPPRPLCLSVPMFCPRQLDLTSFSGIAGDDEQAWQRP
jgi:hypothetical protein